jgi:hypothetical protein
MKKLLAALIVLVAIASGAEATLIDLHNGLVLDTFNGIYWTQNANMRGPDTWPNQLAWAADLNFAGLSDFHLPSLAALRNLYNELIAEGLCKPNAFSTGVSDCAGSIGPFTEIQVEYWSGTTFPPPLPPLPFFISFANGQSTTEFSTFPLWAWAVHAVVPEPPAWLLVGLSLIALVLLAEHHAVSGNLFRKRLARGFHQTGFSPRLNVVRKVSEKKAGAKGR